MQMSTDRTWGGPFDPTLEPNDDGSFTSTTTDNITPTSYGSSDDEVTTTASSTSGAGSYTSFLDSYMNSATQSTPQDLDE